MHQAVFKFIKKPIIKFSISILIIAALFYWVPVEELWVTIEKVSLWTWFLVFFGFVIGHLIGVIKWRLLINIGEKDVSIWLAIRFYFAGLFANLFLPSLAGGDVVKAGLAIRSHHEKSVTIIGTLIDRIIDTASIVFIILLAVLFSPEFLQPKDERIVYMMLLFLLGALLAVGLILMLPVEKFKSTTVIHQLTRVKKAIRLIQKKPARPVTAFVLSLIIQAGFILLTIFLAEHLGIYIPFVLWFLIWPLAKLAALLPISLGGIGVREVALAALLSRIDIPAANSIALGLVWESILIAAGIFGGGLYMISNFFSKQETPSLFGISKSPNGIEN